MANDSLKVVVTAAVKDAIRDLGLVDKQINKTAGAAETWSKKLGSVGSSLSKNLTLPLAAAAIASVKFAADIEKQNLAFGVLLRDTAKGTALFESLKKFSAETPLELEDITKGAQTLLAFGVSASDVKDELQMLGDAAQGDGARLESLVSAYGKVKAKGKASLEELNRFTENGVPIVEALANGYGVTTSELMKMVSAGKVGFPQVQAAMEKLTGKGGLFEDMMKRMSQTTAGKFSTAMDNLKLSAAELGTTLLPIANQVIDKVGKMAEKFSALDEGSKKAILTMAGIAALAGPVASTASSMLSLAAAVAKINWASMAGFLAKIGPAGIVVAATVGLAAAIDKAYTNKINSDVGFRHEAIAQDLHLAEKTVAVYQKIADGYGESLATVVQIAKQQGYITDEMANQLFANQGINANQHELNKELKSTLITPAATDTGDAFDETTKSWQQWWQEITKSDVIGAASVAGKNAAKLYYDSLTDSIRNDFDIAAALGEEFDLSAAFRAKREEIKNTLNALFAIDPDAIDQPFKIADASVQGLIRAYQDLGILMTTLPEQEAAGMDPVLLAHSQLDDLINDENAKLVESTRLWALYYEIQLEISDVATDPVRLAALISINEKLREQLGITAQIKEKEEEAKQGIVDWAEIGQNVGQTLRDAILPTIESIAEQLWSGKDAMEGMDETIASAAASILKNIAPFFLKAGLEVIGVNFWAGAALLGLAGLTAIAGSAFQSYANTPDLPGTTGADTDTSDITAVITDTGAIIIETAQNVADAEEEMRKQQLEDLRKHMDLEADVLKDAWDRNLITTAQYIQSLTDLNDQYLAATGTSVPKTPGGTFDPIKRAVYAAAGGADFVTGGPRMMLVGDNPGGRERVTVTPLPAPGGGGSGQTVNNFVIASPTYGIEDLTEKMARIWDRLERRRRIPA
jgi:tape measure domain-containing protein